MWETIAAIKEELLQILNPSAFSADSVEGWLIIVLGIMLIHSLWKKATSAILWSAGAIVCCQILYGLSLTGFNQIIPLSYVFKYDVMTSIAQCFVGTKACDALLYFDSIIIATMDGLWNSCSNVLFVILNNLNDFPDPFPHADIPSK